MYKVPIIPVYKLPKYFIAFIKNPITALQQIACKYGDIVAFGDLNFFSNQPYKPVIFINHPTFIKHVLKDNADNYSRGEILRERKDLIKLDDFLGNGIFLSDALDWQQQHNLVKPLFTADALAKHYTIIANELEILVKQWKIETSKNSLIDVETSIHKSLHNILFYSQFVGDKNFDTTPIFNAFQAVMKSVSFNTSFKKFFQLIVSSVFKKNATDKQLQHIQQLENLVQAVIDQLINNQLQAGALTTVLNNAYSNGTITYKDYRDTVMNFLFAGFETTAAAITWALYCFAKNPNEQQKIYEELATNEISTIENWQQKDLPYLKLCIKEAMRLYPPVWFYIRQCMSDDVIEGYAIKKGSVLVITPFATQQHKSFWTNPTAFSPTNFEKQHIQGKAFVYIPFGQGKRICIGQGFANIQMQMIMAALLSKFSFENPYKKEPAINAAIIIKGQKPLQLIVKNRN